MVRPGSSTGTFFARGWKIPAFWLHTGADFDIMNWKEVERMLLCIPVTIVATVLAFFYGKSVKHGWLSALITFAIVLASGLLFEGVGQIAGVVLSAFIIFICFARPEMKRAAREQADREREAEHLPNEEDV